jgi:hypothetical protein
MTQPTSSDHKRAAIDRLVAGDLSESERDELIRWFEEQPARWRQCGLAFLETQLWRQAFRPVAERTPHGVAEPARRRDNAVLAHKDRSKRAFRILSTVAALVVAFGCGLAAGRAPLERAATDRSMAPTAQSERPIPSSGDSPEAHALSATSTDRPQSPTQPDQQPEVENAVVAAAVDSLSPRSSSTGGRALPASRVPEYIERQWERRGYELKQTQRWLPLALQDGRHVVVPVDQLQLKYVGRPVY